MVFALLLSLSFSIVLEIQSQSAYVSVSEISFADSLESDLVLVQLPSGVLERSSECANTRIHALCITWNELKRAGSGLSGNEAAKRFCVHKKQATH